MDYADLELLKNPNCCHNFLQQGLLERLAAGPVIGDGGFIFALEKRGFVKVFVFFSMDLSRYLSSFLWICQGICLHFYEFVKVFVFFSVDLSRYLSSFL